jgi:hypothetical protein
VTTAPRGLPDSGVRTLKRDTAAGLACRSLVSMTTPQRTSSAAARAADETLEASPARQSVL